MKNGTLKNDLGLLILRVGVASLMLLHGFPKFMHLISGDEIKFVNPIGLGIVASFVLATFAEFVCAACIILGLQTRIASAILVINMVVIVFIQHGQMAFSESSKQMATLYLLGFVATALLGSGQFSLDALIKRQRKLRFSSK